ncbi:hypothetical protein CYLTODRAFT_341809 [Cylindrobasidium torrendii FP15055 ss-10]|uniref:Zn(2)-C6 fungal-type domain-containing protein n=1 Tax=Cylindrobasidium torrendii FP15055 ss-10 TaxID=1314674 RepID=A0A0D7BTS7_9AGAR|nr:hypothetical protein CYLTODRAFT_341809 [Cylindrobasidium torrendii FP15055 ss-10]
MPVDISNHKRAARKQSNDEDLDLRRARGEISCAECRRLKLKCDKKLPCGSCIRRGCPSICPNGSLSTGQGTRCGFVLADTSQLHNKISEMGQRIRQLEDALAIFQAGVSNETHPLLREELLAIKFGPDSSGITPKEKLPLEHSLNAIDALGTLTIGDRPGDGKYFGRSAGSETLFLAGADLEMSTCAEDDGCPVSIEVAKLSNTFPFHADGSVDVEAALDSLLDDLPERPRAWTLCETYLEHASWAFRPIRREEIIDDILTPIYKCMKDRANGINNASQTISSHKLAVLYMLFSIGSLVDLTLEPYSLESEKYYHLCRAALSLRSIFDSPEISTVQAVVLMASYHAMGGKRYTMDSAWSIMSLGAKLAQSLGLHRDSARWKMDAKIVQRRRALFHEIFCCDLFYSIALGRPPSVRLSYCDCEFPFDEDATLDDEGNVKVGYYRWKYEFCKEIFSQILELTLTAEPPSYQTILDLDRKVREKALPPHLNVFRSPDDEQVTPSAYMHGCLLSQYRVVSLLYLHRSFFAQAMLDHPINPLRSPYAPSFLAAYRCASGVIKSSLNYYERFPQLFARLWSVWTHLFSASIIVGTIVTRSPASSMAANAFIELGLACDLFEKGAPVSRRARSGYGILASLKAKAYQAYSHFRSGQLPAVVSTNVGNDYGNDELALFGGQTKVLFSKLMARRGVNRRTSGSHTSDSSPRVPSTPGGEPSKDSPASSDPLDVHPSLVEYLALLPQDQHPQYSPPPTNDTETVVDGTSGLYDQLNGQLMNMNPYLTGYNVASSSRTNPTYGTTYLPSDVAPNGQTNANGASTSYYGQIDEPSSFTASPTFEPPGLTEQDHYDSNRLMDFGMMGEAGIDDSWKTFMRMTGILEGEGAVPPDGPS